MKINNKLTILIAKAEEKKQFLFVRKGDDNLYELDIKIVEQEATSRH